MLKLEDIRPNAQICGILPNEIVRIVQVEAVGADALTIYYKSSSGGVQEQMLFRANEAELSLAVEGKPWALDGDGEAFKLALETWRISQAALFDPLMAVHASNVEPLPHQITAVYESMLPLQPLRFVLADDPGAGKTIMAGLLIKELLMRADARRILIVSPGSLTEQWQDELWEKFGLRFEIFSAEKQEQSASGNYFEECNQLICRLDQLARNEDYQEKLSHTEWDLTIIDEAHKMSANCSGDKRKNTKRFNLGERLGKISRHFLLMTATPHNGKEEDFQAWLSLLDSDRFYGKVRDGVKKNDVSDLMRRMVKEDLLKFDGTPLFPERRAYTAGYKLSAEETSLYEHVSNYVRNEMNRADKLDGQKKNNIGFALTILQRRLASSPAAIHQSLKRRHERLEERLKEARKEAARSPSLAEPLGEYTVRRRIRLPEDWDDFDDNYTAEEHEALADQFIDQTSAAQNISELEAEITILKDLEREAQQLVASGCDTKWKQLSKLLQETAEMKNADGRRRKLIIFTEHKDTLDYLAARIGGLLGAPEAVRTISGSTKRDDRRKIQEEFRTDKNVLVLIATDAAGEGVNLQNANLMVNYDLPWNPNRLEQRFGRIHRIGQTEVCHLWNLVAENTREGAVFQRLFDKIETERAALGGKVFDVLGEAFQETPLRDLLVDAIRYGEQPETKAKMQQAIESALDTQHLRTIIRRHALVEQHISLEDLYTIKEQMEQAEARKLQPYFIRAYFQTAFAALDGILKKREAGRYEISHVPAKIRERDRVIGESRTPVMKKYERICFEKHAIRVPGKAQAELIQPAHPLMHAILDLTLEAHRATLKQGAILLDPTDPGNHAKMLYALEHTIRENDSGKTVSRRLQFITIDAAGNATFAGWAPHLDLEPLPADLQTQIHADLAADWQNRDLEALAMQYAAAELAPTHYQETRDRRDRQVKKIHDAVHERLVKEINYQQSRASKLEEDVAAGKQPKFAPDAFWKRAEELNARLQQREKELTAMRNIVSSPPNIIAGALIVPQGLLERERGTTENHADADARATIERIAMQTVDAIERAQGCTTRDVSAAKCGWDITAQPPADATGSLPASRHIEVKGRSAGQTTITVSRNEILYALNQADKYWLAIVIVEDGTAQGAYYLQNPFTNEPDFGVASINYDLQELIARAQWIEKP